MAFTNGFCTRIITAVLLCTGFLSTQAQQTMFKINYDVNNFDFPSKLRESLTPGNYIFAGWNTNFIPISSTLTEVNSSGNIVWSRRYSGSGLLPV